MIGIRQINCSRTPKRNSYYCKEHKLIDNRLIHQHQVLTMVLKYHCFYHLGKWVLLRMVQLYMDHGMRTHTVSGIEMRFILKEYHSTNVLAILMGNLKFKNFTFSFKLYFRNGVYHNHVVPVCLYNLNNSAVHSPIVGFIFDFIIH